MQDVNLEKAKRYSRVKHNLALLEIGFTLVFLLTVQFSGLSFKFKSFAGIFSSKEVIIIAIYAIFLSFFFNIFVFWLDYFSGYRLEHKFGLSRQNFLSWLKDYFKRILIGGLLYLVMIEVLYIFIRNFSYTWWLWASIFWLIFALLIAKIFPIFILPLFYKLEKLKDQDLRGKILGLAKKTRVKVIDIYRIGLGAKTKKANAGLAGIGGSKRILLSDTLLSNYSSEEIEATLAHEMAHYKFRHFWKLILFSLIATLLAFLAVYLCFNFVLNNIITLPVYDISAFPALAFIFMCFNIIVTPLQNAVSKYFESQADAEAIKLTGKPLAFISLIEKLTRQNLSDPDPSKIVEIFFYDHPPASKRIKAAKLKI